MPLMHACKLSPTAVLQEPLGGLSLNVASLLHCEREMFLHKAYNELAVQGLRSLCESPRLSSMPKPETKRVTKARTHSVKKDKARLQDRAVKKMKMSPLPPPPSLVSLKQWETLKLQLNPTRP